MYELPDGKFELVGMVVGAIAGSVTPGGVGGALGGALVGYILAKWRWPIVVALIAWLVATWKM